MQSAIHDTAQQAGERYTAAMSTAPQKQPAKQVDAGKLLRLYGEAEPGEFEYGQTVYILNGADVVELTVYGYSKIHVRCTRPDGKRVIVPKNLIYATAEKAARAALGGKAAGPDDPVLNMTPEEAYEAGYTNGVNKGREESYERGYMDGASKAR